MIAVSPNWLQNALHMSMTQTLRASVAAIVIADGSGRLESTATAINEQVYELAGTVVVGNESMVATLDQIVITGCASESCGRGRGCGRNGRVPLDIDGGRCPDARCAQGGSGRR